MPNYFRLKHQLYAHFYRLTPVQRITIIAKESTYLLIFCMGYAFCVATILVRNVATSANASVLNAINMGKIAGNDPSALVNLLTYVVLGALLILCAVQAVFGKQQNDWARGTATFLVGFFARAITSVAPPFAAS